MDSKFQIAAITISDRASADQYETGDLSGAAIVEYFTDHDRFEVATTRIIPDEREVIKDLILEMA